MVYNRLVRRLRSLGLTDFGHYLNLLESNQHSGEWQAFINSLTTNLTAFFREAHHFLCSRITHIAVLASIAYGARRLRPAKSRTALR